VEKTLTIADCGLRIADLRTMNPADCGQSTLDDWGLRTMNSDDMKKRTKAYALAIIRLVQSLPATPTARLIGNQLLKCGTSVGANYRASCRAKSLPDFIAKMGIVEEEADESLYWMELLVDSSVVLPTAVSELCDEGNQLVAIVVSSINSARGAKR
jgi:four helix bundle protein